jgi:hypothetical protein
MTDESHADLQLRLRLETTCRRIAAQIAAQNEPGAGFALFLFDLGPGGALAYAANAVRADVRRAMLEWLHVTAEPDDTEVPDLITRHLAAAGARVLAEVPGAAPLYKEAGRLFVAAARDAGLTDAQATAYLAGVAASFPRPDATP